MKNNKIKILLVEDNPGDARLTIEYLKEKGFNENLISHSVDLRSARQFLSENEIDIILLDLGLPDSKHFDTIRNIFKIIKDKPIIVLTGNHDEMCAVDSLKSGVQEFLIKGEFSNTGLERSINSAIIRSKVEIELKRLNSFKSNLLSILSHDLRSPFTALNGYLDLTILELEKLSKEEIEENLLEVKKISLSVLSFIENLLAWSRLQRDKFETKPQKFSLSELKDKSSAIIELAAKSKRIDIRYTNFDGLYAFADLDMIEIVMRNLLLNAVKFSNENSAVDVVVRNNKEIFIEIIDYGIGIPDEILKNIFIPDHEIVQQGTRNEKGHGLGLLICKEFIEKNGGRFEIYSSVDKGTKVIFSIPRAN